VAAVGLGLCLNPAIDSLRLSYLFWQQPALDAALDWTRVNQHINEDRDGYFLIPAAVPPPASWKLLKEFDLTGDWAPDWLPQTFALARPWRLYAPRLNTATAGDGVTGSENAAPAAGLSYARLPMAASDPYRIVFASHDAYSRDEGSLFIASPGVSQRLLRFPQKLAQVRVSLRNLGAKMATVRLGQGIFSQQLLTLYPGQEITTVLLPQAWPPLMGGTYPFSFHLLEGGDLWINWQWDKLRMGRQALLQNQYQPAESWLRNNPNPEAVAMRLLALARLRQFDAARQLLADPETKFPVDGFAKNWLQAMMKASGLDRKLLAAAAGVYYPLVSPSSKQDVDEIILEAHGFSGVLERRLQSREGLLKIRLKDLLPQGKWLLSLLLEQKAIEPLEIELWTLMPHRPPARLAGAVLGSGRSQADLRFTQMENASPLELRIKLPQNVSLIAGFRLAADLEGHFEDICNYYWEARAILELSQSQYSNALDCLNRLHPLSPTPILTPEQMLLQAQALLGAGLNDNAFGLMAKLASFWPDQPERLEQLRNMYQSAGETARAQELERVLAYLRPSIGKFAHFAGGMAFLGYDGPAANEISVGGNAGFQFYWQALETPIVNADIFLHLLGPEGNFIAFHRLQPSMTWLRPGQVVRERVNLELPLHLAPGNYRLYIGLLDRDYSNQRLYIEQGEDKGSQEMLLMNLKVRP
jgi:tetratricopeptide (TPR) repeat protein